MSENSSSVMLVWRNRYLKNGALIEEDYHKAWQDAEQLQQSGRVSLEQWIELTKLANAALLASGNIPSIPSSTASD